MWPKKMSIHRRCGMRAPLNARSGAMANRCPATIHSSGRGTGRRVRQPTAAIATKAKLAPTKKWVNQWKRASWP